MQRGASVLELEEQAATHNRSMARLVTGQHARGYRPRRLNTPVSISVYVSVFVPVPEQAVAKSTEIAAEEEALQQLL